MKASSANRRVNCNIYSYSIKNKMGHLISQVPWGIIIVESNSDTRSELPSVKSGIAFHFAGGDAISFCLYDYLYKTEPTK